MHDLKISEAAAALAGAKTLLITAGAGMGVDSGLPDFRGPQGFWGAYPMYQRLGIDFVDAANPQHFAENPAFAWGFYGHRTQLYRQTVPHRGFALLRDWIERFALASFVVTSNVDGQFQKAGFASSEILEVHGSIHYLQCTVPCSHHIWENDEDIPVDHATMHAHQVPRCRRCGAVARPNILMFGDNTWLSERSARQQQRFETFLAAAAEPMVVVELGAGTAIPTIRHLSEQLVRRYGATLIRVNPRESQVSGANIPVALGALEGLAGIGAALA